MALYLLLAVPALAAALVSSRLSRTGLFVVWLCSAALTVLLMPIGSRDYSIYLSDFHDINLQPLLSVLAQDPLYSAAVWLLGHLGVSGPAFYAGLAAIGLWIKLCALNALGGGRSMPIALYMSSFFFLHDFTQIRAGLAIGIWMLGLVRLSRGSVLSYVLLTGIATLIHAQAALGFVLLGVLALCRSRSGARAAALVCLAIVLMSTTQVFERAGYAALSTIPDARAEIYIELAEQGLWVRPNPFSVTSMLALLSALAGLGLGGRAAGSSDIRVSAMRSSSTVVFVSLLLGCSALAVLSSVTVAAFRVSEHFFSLLPLGVWLAACRGRSQPRQSWPLWILAGLLLYLYVFHFPYLLDPLTGEPTREDQ